MAYPRRDHYDDGYYPPQPDDRFTGPAPRRHKSERHRRRSPDGIPTYGENAYPPQRGYSRREPPEPRGVTQPGSSARRPRSPPPYYPSDPTPREPRKDSRREPRHSRPQREPPRGSDRDYPPPRDYASSRDKPRRSHRDEPEYRPRRDRASPPPEYKSRGREGRSHKSRPVSPEPLPRTRDFPPPGYGNDDSKRHRRARSQDRSHKRDVSPARGRERAAAPTSKPLSSSRRKSAPAPTADKAKKQAWWQNPLVQAGARTAFAAGAQAAMQNRNDPNPWLGSKGAKVATAALGAALMDGFGGKKKD